VFEGELGLSQIKRISHFIKHLLKNDDSAIIYVFPSQKSLSTIEIGKVNKIENIL